MTINEKFDEMIKELRKANESWGWGQGYSYNIPIHTQTGKNKLQKLLNSRRHLAKLDFELKVINEAKYMELNKIYNDCQRSIDKIEIY